MRMPNLHMSLLENNLLFLKKGKQKKNSFWERKKLVAQKRPENALRNSHRIFFLFKDKFPLLLKGVETSCANFRAKFDVRNCGQTISRDLR